MGTNIVEIRALWRKNHDVLFRINGKTYFAYHDRGKQKLCDDGRGCKSIVIETEGDLLDEKLDTGEKVIGLIEKSEIEYIY